MPQARAPLSALHDPALPSRLTRSGHKVVMSARATLPTVHGDFVAVAFQNDKDHKDHLAIIKGDLQGQRAVPVRLHSECLTGDVFGSLRCDCREQLTRALAQLAQAEPGAILYLRQEGRGIGLANKIRAYALQENGMDTVEANQHLGFDDDARDYQVAAAMLQLLGVASIELWTNNPRKLEGLEAEGITVVQRQPLEIHPNPHNLRYLQTKKAKSQHLLRDV